jgi:hypothetical protein
MAITAVYYITRAGAAYRRSLDGGTTWAGVPGFTASADSTNDLAVGINPYAAKNIHAIRTGSTQPTFYSNDAYVTNGASNLTSEIEGSPQIQVLDKRRSYFATIESFRLSTDSFGSYNYTTLNGLAPEMAESIRFYMSCPISGVLGINILSEGIKISYLYKTGTAGANWSPINGGVALQAGSYAYIGGVWSNPDNTTIVAVTQDKVWRSTNSGASFNSVHSFTPNNNAPTYIPTSGGSANCIYLVDGDNKVWKSSNLGQSWTVIVTLPGTGSNISAIAFDKYDNGYVSIGDTIYKVYQTAPSVYTYEESEVSLSSILSIAIVTYDCGCPEGFVYNESLDECTKLDPTGKFGNLYADFIECPYILTNCKDSTDIIYADGETSVNMDSFVSKIISLEGTCFYVEKHNHLEYNMITIDASSMIPFDTCFECSPVYTLFSCDNTSSISYCTEVDLSAYAASGEVIKIAIDGLPVDGCFLVGSDVNGDCEGTTDVTVLSSVPNCSECSPAIFKLTGCINNNIVIYVQNNEFEAVNGKSVILDGYGQLCWSVEKVDQALEDPVSVVYTSVYSDCDCCKQYTCNS